MKTRRLGGSDLQVTPVVFGAWAIGGSWGAQADADFVIAGRGLDLFPIAGGEELERLLEELQMRGYTTVHAQDGWILLRKP